MPPSGFSRDTIAGLLQFVRGNYQDLKREVAEGKHPNIDAAIDHEIDTLGHALAKLHVDKEGNLTKG